MFIDFIYLPIYNLLAFFVDVIPGGDLGLAVVAVTIAVRFVFLPLSLSAAKTQEAMKEIQPQLAEIKDKYKKEPQEQAKAMMALYKEKNVKPFSSMLLMFIQIPVLFGLFFVAKDAALYSIDPSLLYPFIPAPETLSALFLGTFPVASPSLVLALFAGLTQYAYAHYSVPVPAKKPSAESSVQDEFGRAMALQMRFLFPFIITFVAFASGALALYLAAGNIFMFAQQVFVKRSLAKSRALAV
jgi:YidC/Oxa1 family membrane protein insertase